MPPASGKIRTQSFFRGRSLEPAPAALFSSRIRGARVAALPRKPSASPFERTSASAPSRAGHSNHGRPALRALARGTRQFSGRRRPGSLERHQRDTVHIEPGPRQHRRVAAKRQATRNSIRRRSIDAGHALPVLGEAAFSSDGKPADSGNEGHAPERISKAFAHRECGQQQIAGAASGPQKPKRPAPWSQGNERRRRPKLGPRRGDIKLCLGRALSPPAPFPRFSSCPFPFSPSSFALHSFPFSLSCSLHSFNP